MSAIRGEKVTFRKKDIVALDRLPSAQAEDPIIVHCPPPRSPMRRTAKLTSVFLGLILLILAVIVFTVESGMFDKPLSQQAQAALDGVAGPRYRAEVGSTVIRFTSDFRLALEARNVNMIDQKSGQHLSTTGSVRLGLDPLQLFRGRIAVADIEAEDIALDTALLPSGNPVKLDDLRIDAVPAAMETIFEQLDMFDSIVTRGSTNSVRISGIDIKLADTANGPLSLVVDNLVFAHGGPSSLQLRGEVALNGEVAELDVLAEKEGGQVSKVVATLKHANLTPFTLKRNDQGVIRQGLNTFADLTVSATRTRDGVEPALAATIDIDPGLIYADGDPQELSGGQINLAYDFIKQTVEIAKSNLRFGATTLPLNGALIDLDKLDPKAGKGFGIDLLVSGGTAAPSGSGEQPVAFDIQATGRYMVTDREFLFPNMTVSSPLGALYGALHIRLGDKSPEISFAGQSRELQTTAIKQLWPFWMAPKVRTWVHGNLFGGTVTDASISVFIPFGRLDEAAGGKGLKLDANQIRIGFDIAGARMNVAGDIPPVRDTAAHFDLTGAVATISIKSGMSYFPSGRSVGLGQGTFVIPSAYDKPLMADIDLAVSGAADAIGELLTYKPVRVLQRAGFTPDDFKGHIDANVKAHFGLLSSQNPPPAEWKAALKLADVDLAKPFSGRTISNVSGMLNGDPKQITLDAKGEIDGIPANIDLTEPVEASSGVQRQRVITATLSDEQRSKVMPGLSDIVRGNLKMVLTRIDDDRQNVQLDLTKTMLDLPWIGWSKGSGIAASAEFEMSGPPENTEIKNFRLKGDGFGASGSLVVGKAGLISADFDSVRLSSLDDFALSVKRSKGNFDVSVSGDSADARPVIARLKSGSEGGEDGDGDNTSVSVRAKLKNVVGFNDEKIGNFQAQVSLRGDKLQTLNFSGVTGSGEAVVSQMKDGGVINITSGDAGAVSRFADLYQHIQGGLLNLAIRLSPQGGWDGSLDVRRFSIVNEQRLHSIVSTPVGNEQRSLNEAVKRDIDTSSQRFQRGFARVISRNGMVGIENGVLRGDQIGATFQGVVRDRKGNMDMTGTFMPAYGLNRLFAELPLIGVILGNGSDRGLIGITFKLTGKFDQPNLQINPLSIIAPGVFRQIFEFQ
ncbi:MULTISPECIES: YhdP family protein [unclassified Rhizobium]|uniref:YhdP family protein n=1 Tax=unclassified Rhizobium TaxID=2613769 RepID=UPI0007EB3F59|nr:MULTISPECIES: AsmA-like C-terminal domain-containing protein [unclassified Rhizobium]ANK85908.1 AsmA-like domain-containing protein [Rhizobium sp. N731]ANL16154.1 AsmA-like domain-containing protein [Rhizobium sp. N1314]